MQSAMAPLNVPAGDYRGAVVVTMPEHPPDYAVWSVASFIYGNPLCLGLIALIFSMRSRDLKMMGDMNGARMYGVKARSLNIFALVLIIMLIIFGIVMMVARDLNMMEDMNGAKSFGDRARWANSADRIKTRKMQSTMVPLNSPPNDGRGPGVVVVEMPEHPRDYIVWSVASIFYGNPCCLGLLAFYYSIKARDRKLLGDMNGARSYGNNACRANGCAMALIIILFIILIVVLISLTNRNPYSHR